MRKKKKRLKSEQDHQEALVEWFGLQYPRYKQLLTITSFGEDIGAIRMSELKNMGLVPGYPDLGLFVPTIRKVKEPKKWYQHFLLTPHKYEFHGALFIEMKSKSGKVAAHQAQIHKVLEREGYKVVVAYDWIEAQEAIKEYLRYA